MKKRIFLILLVVILISSVIYVASQQTSGGEQIDWIVTGRSLVAGSGDSVYFSKNVGDCPGRWCMLAGDQDLSNCEYKWIPYFEVNLAEEIGEDSIKLKEFVALTGTSEARRCGSGKNNIAQIILYLDGRVVYNESHKVGKEDLHQKRFIISENGIEMDTIRVERGKEARGIEFGYKKGKEGIEYHYRSLGDVSASGSAVITVEDGEKNINADLSSLASSLAGGGGGNEVDGSCAHCGMCSVYYRIQCIQSYNEVQRLTCGAGSVFNGLTSYKYIRNTMINRLMGLSVNEGSCVNLGDNSMKSNPSCNGPYCGTLDGSGNSLTCPEGYGITDIMTYNKQYGNVITAPMAYRITCANFGNYNDKKYGDCFGGSDNSMCNSHFTLYTIKCPDGYFISDIISAQYINSDEKNVEGTRVEGAYPIDAVCRDSSGVGQVGGEITLSYTGNVMAWFERTRTTSSNYPDSIIACVDLDLNNICDYLETELDVCGNGVIDFGEECDGTDFGNITDCTDFSSYVGGNLSCDSSCNFNVSLCDSGEIYPPCPIGTSLCYDGTCMDECPPIECDEDIDDTDGFCVVGCTPVDPDCDSGTCDRGDGCGGGNCTIPDPDCDGATCNPGDMCLVGCEPVDDDCECDPLDVNNSDPDDNCDLCLEGNVCVVGCDPVDPDCGGGICGPNNRCAGGNCTIPDPDCDDATCGPGDGCLAYCPTPDLDCQLCNRDLICQNYEGCGCSDCNLDSDSCAGDLVCVDNVCSEPPSCDIVGARWEDYLECAIDAQLVSLEVDGIDCSGLDVNLTIYEDDVIGDELITSYISSFDEYGVSVDWNVIDMNDAYNGPEYYFRASLVDNPDIFLDSGLLRVLDETGCGGNVCSLSYAVISSGAGCIDTNCSEDDEVDIDVKYSGGLCPSGSPVDVELSLNSSEDPDCMFDITTECDSSSNCWSWIIGVDGDIPSECEGLLIDGGSASIYDLDSELLAGPVEVGGSFSYNDVNECDSEGYVCCYDGEGVGNSYNLSCDIDVEEDLCFDGCEPPSCGSDGGQWCSNLDACIDDYGTYYGDNSGDGSHCCSDCDILSCTDDSLVEVGDWSECRNDVRTRSVDFIGYSTYSEYAIDTACSYNPLVSAECYVEKAFPFFSWFNLILSSLILIGYYLWKRRR